MGTLHHRIAALLAAGAGAAVLLAGCSSSPSTPSNTGSPAASASTAGTKVTATETEYSISLSATVFIPGVYTFDVTNIGALPHNLTIEGPGVDKQTSPTVQ